MTWRLAVDARPSGWVSVGLRSGVDGRDFPLWAVLVADASGVSTQWASS